MKQQKGFALLEIRFLRGFTLIELLVVIAIIGLFASFVLVSIRGSQAKAKDSSIKSFMHQLRNAAEMNYSKYESYDAVCDENDNTLSNNGEFGILEQEIKARNGNQSVTCIEAADKKSFAASSPLVAREGKYWCVESAGASVELDQAITSDKCQ